MSDLQGLFNCVMFISAIIFIMAAILVSLKLDIGWPFIALSSVIFVFDALVNRNDIGFLIWTAIIALSCRKMAIAFEVPEFTAGKEDEECITHSI